MIMPQDAGVAQCELDAGPIAVRGPSLHLRWFLQVTFCLGPAFATW